MFDVLAPPRLAQNIGAGYLSTPSHRERDDTYHGEIVKLGSRWRVVICKHRIQWILQRRSKNPPHRGYWRGHSYFTSRDALLEACARRGLLSDAKARGVLEVLPEQAREFPLK